MKAKSGAFAVLVVFSFFVGSYVLVVVQPPTGLAAPTGACQIEVEILAALFLLSVAFVQPAKDLLHGHLAAVSGLLERKVELPTAARAIALLAALAGSFLFAFWATADLLGGYGGYGYSFAAYPFLPLIYKAIGLRYLSSLDVGSQASLSFLLAVTGLTAFRANRGIGPALKDSITLFAAPTLILFELALWYLAPMDMTWHVADFVSIGGVADGGYRALDGAGVYLVSNWLVLFGSLFLVATRIPWLGLPSEMLWYRKRAKFQRIE